MRRFTIASLVTALSLSALLLGGCAQGSDIPEPSGELARETTETAVFYATGRSLFEERHIVDAENVYLSTLEKWLEATPVENPDVAIVQPEADVLDATLDDSGLLTVDWSAEVLAFDATPSEQLIALAGILRTYGQFPEVEQVRFIVEGQDSGMIGDADVEIFWGGVTLRDQPRDVIRPGTPPGESEETTT